MTDKDSIKERLRKVLLDKEKQNDADLISKEQAQKESEGDIVSKTENYSILPKKDKK